jgi:hypothetical protein
MVTPIPARNNPPLKLPIWALWLGLFGIGNFLVGCWFLFPPAEGHTVYFWFAQLYSPMLLPLLIFLPFGILMVFLWFSRFLEKSWKQIVMILVGFIVSGLCYVPAFGTAAFLSTLRVIGNVKQNESYYYLVKHYDDWAPYYSFCVSDSIGFSGQCRYIGWSSDDHDPVIYLDETTNLVTVESQKPAFIWVNSVPPKCTNTLEETTEEEFVGGCSP